MPNGHSRRSWVARRECQGGPRKASKAPGERTWLAQPRRSTKRAAQPRAIFGTTRSRLGMKVLEGWNRWDHHFTGILERVTVERGTRVLDMGCGAGRFCRVAADRGSHLGPRCDRDVCSDRSGAHPGGGIPCRGHRASPLAGQLVRRRHRPNSFIFAANILRALREARRVAGPVGTSRSPCSGGRNGANQQTYSGRLDSFCQHSPAPVRCSGAAK